LSKRQLFPVKGSNPTGRRLAKFSFVLTCFIILLTTAGTSFGESYNVDIPSQVADLAFRAFAEQTDYNMIYSIEDLGNPKTQAVTGTYSAEQALDILLDGTGLGFKKTGEKTIVIKKTSPPKAIQTAVQSADKAIQKSGSAGQPRGESYDDYMFEETIVTATKRNVKLQDVPLAITALNENRLKELGAKGFEDFANTIPGLVMGQVDRNRGSFVIRGVATVGNQTQSPVGLYIDDMPTLDSFAATSAPDLNLFDVNRVEVLRGPQGTLFGSGALGGAIRVITNKPELTTFAVEVDTELSTITDGSENYAVNAMVNVPVVKDRLALRGVAYYRDESGWEDNVGVGVEESNSSVTSGARIMARLQATDELQLTATVTYQNIEVDDGYMLSLLPNGQVERNTFMLEPSEFELTIYNLAATYDLGWAELFSSTSYGVKDTYYANDITALATAILGLPIPSPFVRNEEVGTFVQEVRLTSSDESRLKWIAGAFYLKATDPRVYEQSITIPGSGAIFGLFGFPSDVIYNENSETETQERALFGEVTYELTDGLEATFGMRWFDYNFDRLQVVDGFLNFGRTEEQLDASDSGVITKFVLSYHVNDDAMVYAQAAEGYRVGNANSAIPDPTVPVEYGPDSLWNYEIGAKTVWFDNHLIANGAIYYIDWKDIQLDQITGPFNYINNGGEAHTMGLELELSWLPIRGLNLSSAITLMEAEIDTANDLIGARKGDRMPWVPEFSIANAAQYSFPVLGDAIGHVRIDHQYIGRAYSQFNPADSLEMGHYHQVNLRAGLMFESWEVSLFARNLFDEDSVALGFRNDILGNQLTQQRPRIIGLNVRVRF